MTTKYKYVKILHRGENYVLVRHDKTEHEVTGAEMVIIETLLKKINKS